LPAPDLGQRPSSWIEFVRLLIMGQGRSYSGANHECSQEHPAAAVQLHIAEYQALTTRITYWIPIQYSLGGAIIFTLFNFAQSGANHAPSGIFIWATVIAIEFYAAAYCFVLFEIMTDSDYIENKLSERVKKNLPGVKEFWGNQRFRKVNRIYSPIGLYIPLILGCIIPPYVALFFRPVHREIVDGVCAAFSMVIALWAFWITYKAASAQRRFAP
jgi:hypothetical protein